MKPAFSMRIAAAGTLLAVCLLGPKPMAAMEECDHPEGVICPMHKSPAQHGTSQGPTICDDVPVPDTFTFDGRSIPGLTETAYVLVPSSQVETAAVVVVFSEPSNLDAPPVPPPPRA